jgi:hypothetical protein
MKSLLMFFGGFYLSVIGMSFENFLNRAFSALSEAGLEYVIIGGVAAIAYGRLRSTADLDVAINLQLSDRDSIANLASAFRKYGLFEEINTLLSNQSKHRHDLGFILYLN